MAKVGKLAIGRLIPTLSQKSATAAENRRLSPLSRRFCDSRTFLRQCGQGFTYCVDKMRPLRTLTVDTAYF